MADDPNPPGTTGPSPTDPPVLNEVEQLRIATIKSGGREQFVDALIATIRAENAQVRIAADEWQKCAREQATMIEELAERICQLERKLADVYPELR